MLTTGWTILRCPRKSRRAPVHTQTFRLLVFLVVHIYLLLTRIPLVVYTLHIFFAIFLYCPFLVNISPCWSKLRAFALLDCAIFMFSVSGRHAPYMLAQALPST
jgi:hypothetical protein